MGLKQVLGTSHPIGLQQRGGGGWRQPTSRWVDTILTTILRTHPGRWGKPYSSQSIRTSLPGSHSGEATSDHDAIGVAVIAQAAETEVYIVNHVCHDRFDASTVILTFRVVYCTEFCQQPGNKSGWALVPRSGGPRRRAAEMVRRGALALGESRAALVRSAWAGAALVRSAWAGASQRGRGNGGKVAR